MKSKLLFLAFFVMFLSFGQTTLPVTRTSWDISPTGWTDLPLDSYLSTFACTTNNGAKFDTTTDQKIVYFTGVPNQLSFLVKSNTTASTSILLVEESSDGVTYTSVASLTGNTGLPTICTTSGPYTLLPSTSYIRWSFNKGTSNLTMDDVTITSGTPTPTITVTPTTLSGFTYGFGAGPSAQQSFTASGSSLTGNVVLTAPTNYEISTTSGSGFTNSITLTQVAGSVSATTIYVRLKAGLAVNAYNESVTATSSGATNKTVAFSGTVTGSVASDIVAVTGSEATSISSTINNAAPLSATTGVQVFQFKVRDGGATLNDSDVSPTILTAFTILQASGNEIGTWTDAINTIALFDGTTFIATGTVTATSIVFTGLNVSVADNTEKTLSLRLSLKCPFGADAFDGEDFGFSISNTNTTFSATGSGKIAFPAVVSTNGLNVVAVVATRLAFLVQPITTGINGPMNPSVKVRALDACGNFDSGFNGTVNITSSGALLGTTITAIAVNGIATFTNVTHTAPGTNLTLSATSTGLIAATSNLFNINNVTVLQPGDIIILAFNSGITTGEDEISFVPLVDILPGTRIDMTDNAYQKCNPLNGWGISEGWIRLERTNTILTKGTIVTVRVASGTPSIFSPDPSNWITSKPQPTGQGTFDLNANGEQIFFMSGGNVGGPSTVLATSDAGTYSGNFIFGFNTKGNIWTPFCANTAGGGTSNSAKPLNFDCFLTWPTTQADLNKYTGLVTPTSKRDWIERINNPSNWTGYASNALYDAGPDFYGGLITITAGGFTDGVWIGSSNDNWFDCGNWQALKVPDENINVVLDSNSLQGAKVDFTAQYADLFAYVAKCRSLSISNQTVTVASNINNVLSVFGNLTIGASGILNMDDGNNATTDGQLFLNGNWTNNVTTDAFKEGNGTVQFIGTSPQIINNVAPEGTEVFYNVVMDNNYDTATSNSLIASNNLDVKVGKTVTVNPNTYVQVDKNLNVLGTLNVSDTGSLYQRDDTGINSGVVSVQRNATIRKLDYVYWSSPVEGFSASAISAGTPSNFILKWNTTLSNPNGGQGFWEAAAGNTMTAGKGYIVRGSDALNTFTTQTFTATFNNGKPHNGVINQTISRGNMIPATLGTYTSANGIPFTVNDDNWNLIGNPYPSAISANAFLQYNAITVPIIEGAVRIWTHGTLPVSTINPFYASYAYNYTASDYIIYNGTATTSGPTGFNGFIGSGQGFFVLMNDGASASASVTFNNAMRTKGSTNNSQFYKPSNATVANTIEEKSRIWLDLISSNGTVERTVVGYVQNATLEKDVLYDAYTRLDNNQRFYSLINDEIMCIQGRPLPFDQNDQVPLGLKLADNSPNYTIAIAVADGLFDENQPVFLEDKVTSTIHDLRTSPYNFSALNGIYNDRFVLRYTNSNLGTDAFTVAGNSVAVATLNKVVTVRSSQEAISSVVVYDILGRELVRKAAVNANEISIDTITATKQTLIVKIELENGEITTRKIVL